MATINMSQVAAQTLANRLEVRSTASSSAGKPVACPLAAKSARFSGNGVATKKSASVAMRTSVATCAASKAVSDVDVNLEKMGQDVWNTTYYPKEADHRGWNKPWYVIDAEGQTLGRLAVLASQHVRGSNTPVFHPAFHMGGNVVVINAEKVKVTGNKYTQKEYKRHGTGVMGSMKVETFDKLQKRIPERIIEKAVKGMLPKGRLGRQLFTNLKVYKGGEHPHSAQMPLDITDQINK